MLPRVLILVLAALAVVVAGIALGWWLRRRLLEKGGGEADVQMVLRAVGPARCIAAIRCFDTLARRGDSAAIARAVDAIELPLVQAIPDCPPDLKVALINALDAAARACRERDAARRLLTLRNSLIA